MGAVRVKVKWEGPNEDPRPTEIQGPIRGCAETERDQVTDDHSTYSTPGRPSARVDM